MRRQRSRLLLLRLQLHKCNGVVDQQIAYIFPTIFFPNFYFLLDRVRKSRAGQLQLCARALEDDSDMEKDTSMSNSCIE
jgi:hypothetical protein